MHTQIVHIQLYINLPILKLLKKALTKSCTQIGGIVIRLLPNGFLGGEGKGGERLREPSPFVAERRSEFAMPKSPGGKTPWIGPYTTRTR